MIPKLKTRREELGLSQEKLAEKAGVTKQAISAYELGSRVPGAGVLALIADALNCSTDYLLGRAKK